MASHLDKLVQAAGPALVKTAPVIDPDVMAALGPIGRELEQLLSLKNGFYAFKSALHVFPAYTPLDRFMNLEAWNNTELWRTHYQDLASGCFFFAEDLFGCQFCYFQGQICSFDPETGDKEAFAPDLETWAARILDETELHTGYPLAVEWIRAHSYLEPHQRLVPVQPFVAGGAYAIENLRAVDAVEAMRFRGKIAQEIHDLPDDASLQIQFEV